MPGQPGQPQGPPGMSTGMGRGTTNAALQSIGLNNIGHPPPQQVIQGDLSEHKQPSEHNHVLSLNTYIYDHLVKHGFNKAAKGLLQEAPINTLPRDDGSPPNRDADGSLLPRRTTNLKRSHSGMDDHPNSSPNDKPNGKSPRSNSNSPHIGHNDLPAADVPVDTTDGFLSQWWVVFWEIFEARTNPENGTANARAFIEYQVFP
jgi:LisH